jgi:hypothetical protein
VRKKATITLVAIFLAALAASGTLSARADGEKLVPVLGHGERFLYLQMSPSDIIRSSDMIGSIREDLSDRGAALRFTVSTSVKSGGMPRACGGYLYVSADRVTFVLSPPGNARLWSSNCEKFGFQAFDYQRSEVQTRLVPGMFSGELEIRTPHSHPRFHFRGNLSRNLAEDAIADFGSTKQKFDDLMRPLEEQQAAERAANQATEKAAADSFKSERQAGGEAEAAGRMREALQHYVAALQAGAGYMPAESDQKWREKIIKLVSGLNPPPALPEDAIRHAAYAQAAIEEAQKDANPSHVADAIKELQEALRIAPWWADAYFNLGAVLKKADRPGEAAQAFQLYLLANPNAQNAQDVKMEIYRLEYEAKNK